SITAASVVVPMIRYLILVGIIRSILTRPRDVQ
ncbi:MAG: hypothetical protein ACI9HK_005210, partial [Pirellulaceae bacterium]